MVRSWTLGAGLALVGLCSYGNISLDSQGDSASITDGNYTLYPLGVACRAGNLERVKQLLAVPEEPMAMAGECFEYDVLYAAIHYNQQEILRYALSLFKEDINNRQYSDEYGLTLLVYACIRGDKVLAKILLEYGACVNGYQSPYDLYLEYPLMVAVGKKDIELVRLLLAYGADTKIRNSSKETPLDAARVVGAPEIERVLEKYILD